MSFISRQPNGLLCRFSTVLDTVTHINMTDEEYIEMKVNEARNTAKLALQATLNPFDRVIDYFQPYNHTVEEFNALLGQMGSDVILKEEDYD